MNELRANWLNPPDLVKPVPEVVAGYPDRILPISPEADAVLKNRTLTNLYNATTASSPTPSKRWMGLWPSPTAGTTIGGLAS